MEDKRAEVNIEMVVQILSNKISNLITENAVLQARNADLENQVKELQVSNDKGNIK